MVEYSIIGVWCRQKYTASDETFSCLGAPYIVMLRRFIAAIIGGLAGVLLGLALEQLTGWRWWVRICAALGPAAALLLAERKRLVRTPDELNRPTTLFDRNEQ